MFYGGETAILRFCGLVECRIPREVVIDFGQRNQCYNVGALDGNTPSEILEADIAREYFVDPLEMQGKGPDYLFSGLGPVGGGYRYNRGGG